MSENENQLQEQLNGARGLLVDAEMLLEGLATDYIGKPEVTEIDAMVQKLRTGWLSIDFPDDYTMPPDIMGDNKDYLLAKAIGMMSALLEVFEMPDRVAVDLMQFITDVTEYYRRLDKAAKGEDE